MNISKKLIEEYNQPVPRYTSYPPANYFTNNFSQEAYSKLITKSNQEAPQHLSFYVHIPFCNQICHYCGCNSTAKGNSETIKKYVAAVKKEINAVIQLLNKNRKIAQIHYGGGTPNFIKISYLQEINQLFFDNFQTIENPEIAIECHPGILMPEHIDELLKAGFNRFSLGIQDFDDQILKNVNRKPSFLPVHKLVEQLRASEQVRGINMDFIYGLPGQTPESFVKSIEQAIAIRPDRLVTFSYAHVPWIKTYQNKLEKIGLPTPDEKKDMFLSAYYLLKNQGYVPIGFDHYALPKDELATAMENKELHRNFQGYTTRRTTGQVYAFGVSAISQLNSGYIQNTKDIKTYVEQIEKQLFPFEKGIEISENQKIIGKIITQIMCNRYINWKKCAEQFGIDEQKLKTIIVYNEQKLNGFAKNALLKFTSDEIEITEKGNFFIRNIAASFDPLIGSNGQIYSKSI